MLSKHASHRGHLQPPRTAAVGDHVHLGDGVVRDGSVATEERLLREFLRRSWSWTVDQYRWARSWMSPDEPLTSGQFSRTAPCYEPLASISYPHTKSPMVRSSMLIGFT